MTIREDIFCCPAICESGDQFGRALEIREASRGEDTVPDIRPPTAIARIALTRGDLAEARAQLTDVLEAPLMIVRKTRTGVGKQKRG